MMSLNRHKPVQLHTYIPYILANSIFLHFLLFQAPPPNLFIIHALWQWTKFFSGALHICPVQIHFFCYLQIFRSEVFHLCCLYTFIFTTSLEFYLTSPNFIFSTSFTSISSSISALPTCCKACITCFNLHFFLHLHNLPSSHPHPKLTNLMEFQSHLSSILHNLNLFGGCGGSLVVHQTVKPAVPGSNLASLQPAGTYHSLSGSQQDWHGNAGWPLRGGRGKKYKNTKKQ